MMTQLNRILSAALALLLVSVFGLNACSDDDSNPTGGGNPPPAASLTYDDFIRPLFIVRCSGSACHVSSPFQNGLNVTTYAGLLAGGNTLGTGIVPNDPNSSSVYRKLLPNTPIPPRMPFNGPFLAQSTIDSIALWINAGAPQSPPN